MSCLSYDECEGNRGVSERAEMLVAIELVLPCTDAQLSEYDS